MLVTEKATIVPMPLELIPVEVLSFTQRYSTPVTDDPLNWIGLNCSFPHMMMSGTGFTINNGFTFTSNDTGIPVHPLVNGETVIVLFIEIFELFWAVNEGIFPDPLVGSKPISLLD